MLPHIVEQVSDTTSDEFMATFSGFNEPVLCYFGRYINVQNKHGEITDRYRGTSRKLQKKQGQITDAQKFKSTMSNIE